MTDIEEKKISIIVPVYNSEKYLERCIESILNQTYKNLEVIIVKDGSTDGSGKICDMFAARDTRVSVIHKENGGPSSARNAGLKAAVGDYIGFIDSDDYIDEEMYGEMITSIAANKSQMCVCTKYIVDNEYLNNCSISEDLLTRDEAITHLLKMNFPTSLCSCLYLKDALQDEFLNEDIYYWEDFEYQFRAVLKISKISVLHYSWYHYRQHEGSANSRVSEKNLTCLKIAPIISGLCSNMDIDIKKVYYLYSFFIFKVVCTIAFKHRDTLYDNKELCTMVKSEIKNRKTIILKSRYPLKMKMAIFLFYINERLLCFLYNGYKRLK